MKFAVMVLFVSCTAFAKLYSPESDGASGMADRSAKQRAAVEVIKEQLSKGPQAFACSDKLFIDVKDPARIIDVLNNQSIRYSSSQAVPIQIQGTTTAICLLLTK